MENEVFDQLGVEETEQVYKIGGREFTASEFLVMLVKTAVTAKNSKNPRPSVSSHFKGAVSPVVAAFLQVTKGDYSFFVETLNSAIDAGVLEGVHNTERDVWTFWLPGTRKEKPAAMSAKDKLLAAFMQQSVAA